MVATTFNRPRVHIPTYDQHLLWAMLILLGIGLVMVFSASIAIADNSKMTGYNSHYYLIRQAIFITLGVIVGAVAFKVPVAWWQKTAPTLFILGIILLIIVLIIPGGSGKIKGAQRWIPLYFVNFQPSEVMKLLVAMYVADFAVRKAESMNDFKRSFIPMLIVMLLIGVLLLLQPDYGAFAVMTATAISILWLGGMNIKIFIGILVLFAISLTGFIFSAAYRLDRIRIFLDGPWSDPWDKGYQLSHSFMAYGRGEWFGVGLGASIEKLLYLPDAHTDFLLSVIAEELGFVGVATVIGLLGFIVVTGFRIAKEAIRLERHFAALFVQGISVWIGIQSIINIGGSMGFLPSKGLTLPLLSFGGSSMLVSCVAMAIILKVDVENKRIQRGLPV